MWEIISKSPNCLRTSYSNYQLFLCFVYFRPLWDLRRQYTRLCAERGIKQVSLKQWDVALASDSRLEHHSALHPLWIPFSDAFCVTRGDKGTRLEIFRGVNEKIWESAWHCVYYCCNTVAPIRILFRTFSFSKPWSCMAWHQHMVFIYKSPGRTEMLRTFYGKEFAFNYHITHCKSLKQC